MSDTERNSGPLSAGDEWEPEEQDDEPNERGCGGGGNEGWLFLALAPLLFRRKTAAVHPEHR